VSARVRDKYRKSWEAAAETFGLNEVERKLSVLLEERLK
jgi:hypothetical protein